MTISIWGKGCLPERLACIVGESYKERSCIYHTYSNPLLLFSIILCCTFLSDVFGMQEWNTSPTLLLWSTIVSQDIMEQPICRKSPLRSVPLVLLGLLYTTTLSMLGNIVILLGGGSRQICILFCFSFCCLRVFCERASCRKKTIYSALWEMSLWSTYIWMFCPFFLFFLSMGGTIFACN